MRAPHSLETHQNLHADHAGNLERISKMILFGNEAATVEGCRPFVDDEAEEKSSAMTDRAWVG
jgi:hypothetical protein